VSEKRRDHEQPAATARRGWRYHHLGIPTTVPHPTEQYLRHLKLYVRGFDSSPYGIEWMRFEPECEVHDLIRTVPHVAFEVDDLDEAVKGCTLLGGIVSPSDGVRAAMIVDDGAPVELIEFSRRRPQGGTPKGPVKKRMSRRGGTLAKRRSPGRRRQHGRTPTAHPKDSHHRRIPQ
jgi:hypothetical protein